MKGHPSKVGQNRMFEIGSWKRYAREGLETFRPVYSGECQASAFVFYLAALSKLRRVPWAIKALARLREGY